jgi:hypothetical protein
MMPPTTTSNAILRLTHALWTAIIALSLIVPLRGFALPRQEFFTGSGSLAGFTQQLGGTIERISGQAGITSGTDAHAYDSDNTYTSSHYAKCVVTVGAYAGPAVMASGTGGGTNAVFVLGGSSVSAAYNVVAGSYASLGALASNVQDGDLVRIKTVDTGSGTSEITIYRNGVSVFNLPGYSNIAGGAAGIYVNGTSARLDACEFGDGDGNDTVPTEGGAAPKRLLLLGAGGY